VVKHEQDVLVVLAAPAAAVVVLSLELLWHLKTSIRLALNLYKIWHLS
jgi:hypothetical protein